MAKKTNTKRKDGRYAVQVYIGLDEDKKRKYKTIYGNTQKEADEKALDLKLQLKKGIDITSENDTFGEWADRWLKTKKSSISESQYRAYRSFVSHLKSDLDNIPISKIKLYEIQSVIDRLASKNPNTHKPTAKKTLHDIKITAKQIFDFAIVNRAIEYNPCTALIVPHNAPKSHRRALIDTEISMIENTPHKAQRASMIMLYAGLRRGELIALTWNDIDLNKKTIFVNKAVEFINGQNPQIKSTKTKSGLRTIPIPQKLVDFLKAETKDSIYVCSNKGSLHTQTSWKCLWNTYLLDLDVIYGNATFVKDGKVKYKKSKYDKNFKGITIERFTPHYLRHTYATMLYKAGVDVLTAKTLLGHADIKTTLGIYTHLDSEFKEQNIEKLNEYLCKSDASQDISETP